MALPLRTEGFDQNQRLPPAEEKPRRRGSFEFRINPVYAGDPPSPVATEQGRED
jgi:hypothetical protein